LASPRDDILSGVRLSFGVVAIAAACGRPAVAPPEAASVMPGIVAHRGASAEAPENTLAAFRRAWELGAESCELDVRVTRDGHVVVIHDATTRRTSGGAAELAVADATLAELRAVDVGSWKHARYAGERIPTLAEALDATPPGRMLFVEIKTTAADAAVIVAAVLAADPRQREATLALQAYDPDALAAVAERLPGVEAYWTVDAPTDDDQRPRPYPADLVRTAAERRFHGLAVDQRGADDAFVAAVATAGLQLDVWTVNDAADIHTWRTRGARWIETDHPELGRIAEVPKKP
jgi:glycerophosphoryl diester phosphodiesterase